MKIAIYARVSTSDGRQHTANQTDALYEWAQNMDCDKPLVFIDEASGGKSDRKALKEMLEGARKRQFQTLLVWALDRLSREGIAQMAGYLEQLKGYGVRVMSHQEPWLDTASPVSELLTAIFAWVAKQERMRFSERIKAGLETARRNGKKLGQPVKEIPMDRVLQLREEGESFRAIAAAVGCSKTKISRALEKP
jgi:putative DNA-invertase from lambdoid prophage Rac